MYKNAYIYDKHSVKNSLRIKNGKLAWNTGVNIGEVTEQQPTKSNDAPEVSEPANNDVKFKLIKRAETFGFSPTEIKKLLVYWNK